MRGEPQKVGVGLRRMRELVEFCDMEYKREMSPIPRMEANARMEEAEHARGRAYAFRDMAILMRALDPER